MAADEPLTALQALNDSDERQRSPIHRLAKPFIDVIRLFAPAGSELTLGGFSTALGWLDKRSAENLSEFVGVLASEMRYRGDQIEKLIRESQAHREFVAENLPGLALDALRRAEEIRARERVKRLARILVRAAEVGANASGDYAEEMLRVAVELEERDLVVLNQIVLVQGSMVQRDSGRVKHYDAYAVRDQVRNPLKEKGLIQGQVDSVCAKLESFGLVSRTERNVNALGDDAIPYALLEKGLDFVDYVKSAADRGAVGTTAE